MRAIALRAVVVAFIVIVGAQNASAVPITLDFDGGNGLTAPISLDGYQIALNSGNFTPNGFDGSPLFMGNAGAEATLTRIDGGAFNLDSIFLEAGDPSINIVFTGLLPGGALVTTSYNSGNAPVNFAFPSSFDGVVSVKFNQGSAGVNAYVFDNLVVESAAVPEPATLGLLGVATLALATTRRRRA